MPCCPNQITYFHNRTFSDVPYEGQFGATPTVTVMYLINGEWRTPEGAMTAIQLQYSEPTNDIMSKALSSITSPVNNETIKNIHVDHGGNATGLIKLS